MRPSPHIGHSFLEQMNLILEFVCRFSVNHLLYAINGKRFNEEDITCIMLDIREHHVRLEKQKEYLFTFGKTWNKKFTHDDNSFFDTSAKVSWKIRSGTAGVKKVFKKFCKVVRKKLPDGRPNPQAHECSMINTENYMGDLFGLVSYPPCVTELFKEMLLFYEDLDDCITESMRIIKEEDAKRSDKEGCLELLLDAQEKSRKAQLHIIEAMEQNPELKRSIMESGMMSDETNPVLRAYRKAKDKAAFAAEYFHNCSPKDVGVITLDDTFSEADEDPGMMYAITVFGSDKQHILHINYAIDNFDDLLPVKCKRDKIPALHLYYFMEWCHPTVGMKSFLNYFNKRYKGRGRWGMIGTSALNGAKGKDTLQKEKEKNEKIKKDMMEKLEEMLSVVFPQEKTA